MEVKEFTCIRCPMGCPLRVELEGKEIRSVSGNTCRRGEEYARQEAVAPMRTVTATVRALHGERGVVACKTVPDVPKESIFPVLAVIRAASVTAPVHIGDVLVRNIAGTGSELVATAELAAKSNEVNIE